MAERVVIVGAGQGGLQAAASLRAEGFTGPVTLIGDEPGLPYQRPPLSKAYMKDGDASRLALKPESFFAQSDIDYRPATIVAAIDRAAGEVVLAGGAYNTPQLLMLSGIGPAEHLREIGRAHV